MIVEHNRRMPVTIFMRYLKLSTVKKNTLVSLFLIICPYTMLYRFMALASRPATRMLFKNTPLRPSTTTKSILYRSSFISMKSLHSSVNWNASSHDWNDQKPVTHPLIEKIQQHPHIMDQLIDFTSLLQAKGVDVSGQRPSFVQVKSQQKFQVGKNRLLIFPVHRL